MEAERISPGKNAQRSSTKVLPRLDLLIFDASVKTFANNSTKLGCRLVVPLALRDHAIACFFQLNVWQQNSKRQKAKATGTGDFVLRPTSTATLTLTLRQKDFSRTTTPHSLTPVCVNNSNVIITAVVKFRYLSTLVGYECNTQMSVNYTVECSVEETMYSSMITRACFQTVVQQT